MLVAALAYVFATTNLLNLPRLMLENGGRKIWIFPKIITQNYWIQKLKKNIESNFLKNSILFVFFLQF